MKESLETDRKEHFWYQKGGNAKGEALTSWVYLPEKSFWKEGGPRGGKPFPKKGNFIMSKKERLYFPEKGRSPKKIP